MNYEDIPLRGMQLPQEVGFWPLAWGWWILLALLVIVPLCIGFYRRWKKRQLSSVAKARLAVIAQNYKQHGDTGLLASELSEVLRQVALSLYERQQVASVTGEQWLELLDGLGKKPWFVSGEGRQIFTCAYSGQPMMNPESVLTQVGDWIDYVTRHPRKGGVK